MTNYYIFGAHSRGQTLGAYLAKLQQDFTNLGYLYDDDQENPNLVNDVPVYKIQGVGNLDIGAIVYIATRGISFMHIRNVLEKYGFAHEKIVPMDAALDIKLRNEFVKGYYAEHGWEFRKIDDVVEQEESTLKNKVYVVKSSVDSNLAMKVPLKKYEAYIQAGRGLTDSDLDDASFSDNTGDNISDKNRQMCELTVLYWIWKNANDSIVGLEHYRRRFFLPNKWESIFSENMADVILPVPLFVHPNLKENYVGRHEEKPWNVMIEELGHIHGMECQTEAEVFFDNTGCYSPCNMLVARKEILNELCGWLFPILFAVQDRCGNLDDNYQNRYPGFLSERLITFFFFWKKEKYKVLYADKSFLT